MHSVITVTWFSMNSFLLNEVLLPAWLINVAGCRKHNMGSGVWGQTPTHMDEV